MAFTAPAPAPSALHRRELCLRDARSVQILARALPIIGFLLAAGLIVSRRPDAVSNAQFFAEDGKIFFADVYNRGLLATLAVPQSGYFQELPTLAAGLAQLVPLTLAPLVMNLVAIAIRALPVGLLLSARAKTISPDLRVRALLASLYIALPGISEADANVDNALWYLAVAAVIVLMLAPAERTRARLLDGTILVMCALTGVFSIALSPLAFLYRRWRGPQAVPKSTLFILSFGAVLQLSAIFVLQHHLPSGFNAAPRTTLPLHASPSLFLQIIGGRAILPSLLGNSLTFSAPVTLFAGVAGILGATLAFRRGTDELRLFLTFAAMLLLMALAHPQGVNWLGLSTPPHSGRYFLIPELAVAATVVWAAGRERAASLRLAAIAMLLFTCVAIIPSEWSYEPYVGTGFTLTAHRFERLRRGSKAVFYLNPGMPWSMTLIKH